MSAIVPLNSTTDLQSPLVTSGRLSFLTICILTVGLSCREQDKGTPQTHCQADMSDPCIVVWQFGGYQHKPNEGLRIAMWRDGTVLYSPNLSKLGENMVAGKVLATDVDEVMNTIGSSGIAARTDNYVVPDSGYTSLIIRDGGRETVHQWHEYLNPGFGGDVNTDANYRAFVRCWKKSMGAIGSLAPVEMARLEEKVGTVDEFRGYRIKDPRSTKWIRWP